MQAGFQHIYTEFDSVDRQLLGLSDMEVVSVSGRTYLLIAGAADAEVSSYEILNDGSLVASDDLLWSVGSGTQGVSDITSFTVGGVMYLLPAGSFDDNQVIYQVDSGGSFIAAQDNPFSGWNMTTAVDVGGNTYLFGTTWSQSGFFQYEVLAGGVLANAVVYADTLDTYLQDVTAISTAVLHGDTYLFVASGLDAGLHSYTVGVDGSLTWLDTVAPNDYGFAGITAVQSVDVGQRAFVIVAVAGVDSLMVLRVSDTGQMNLVERVVDTNDTRFAGVTSMEVFEYNGRYFLIAGGADDGITLFEITYKGQLDPLATVADTSATALQNITDIEVTVVNGQAYVFVSSATDHGFTQFALDLPDGANLIEGGAVEDTLTGTTANDTIYGFGRSDTLYGMAGDDRLVDGRGNDYLWGGTGADVFEFTRDGRKDYIMDFEIGVDKIDLRDAVMLYDISALTINARSYGARIQYGDEMIIITSVDSTRLTADMFSQDYFIFG